MGDQQEYLSIGFACGCLQRSPREIGAAADALNIAPALRLNGVVHYTTVQIEQIAAFFRNNEAAPVSSSPDGRPLSALSRRVPAAISTREAR